MWTTICVPIKEFMRVIKQYGKSPITLNGKGEKRSDYLRISFQRDERGLYGRFMTDDEGYDDPVIKKSHGDI